jgi:hypothetical protein
MLLKGKDVSRQVDIGNRKLEIGNWKLGTGNWKLGLPVSKNPCLVGQ